MRTLQYIACFEFDFNIGYASCYVERKKETAKIWTRSVHFRQIQRADAQQTAKPARLSHATAQRNVMRYAFSASWPMLDGESSPEKCGPNER